MLKGLESLIDKIEGQSSLNKILIPISFLLLILLGVYMFIFAGESIIILVAVVLAFYLALNIGANDVANNMGPAVGSKAITIGMAIIIAAIFEASGAIIAGGDVASTIKSGIIDISFITDPKIFVSIMLATLFGGAAWINIATYTKSPVSTTHSIIGGLIGATTIAVGYQAIYWGKILQIAASWVISPVMGGTIAALLLWSLDTTIIKKEERHNAAQKWVPVYVAVMGGIFCSYLILK